MSKSIAIRLMFLSQVLCCLNLLAPELCGQDRSAPPRPDSPWACSYLNASSDDDPERKNDPAEEKSYDAATNEFYRLWCTADSHPRNDQMVAADRMALQWKALWYRDVPFNTAFHETGSWDLLVLMAITHRVPKSMAKDAELLHDWMEDCSDRCFMLYGDDDPNSHREWLRMMRLRKEVMKHLGGDPAAKQVLKMLKSAKLYPVN